MKRFDDKASNDSWNDNDDEIEITDLDIPVSTGNRAALHIEQSLHFSPKARVWLALSTVVASILLLTIILHPSLTSPSPATVPTVTPIVNASIASPAQLAIENGIAYISGQDGIVYAFNSNDGALLWHYKPPMHVSIKVVDQIVYLLSPDETYGFIIALRASDGVMLWRQSMPNPGPVSLTISDGTVYVSGHDGDDIYALSIRDGSLLWQYEVSQFAPYPAPFATMEVVDGIVYLLSEDNILYAVRASDGFHLWTLHYQDEELGFGLPTVEHGVVYIDGQNGSIKALRAANGALLWQYQPGGGSLWAAVVQNGVVYVDANNGMMRALRASNGFLLHDYKQLGIVTSSPVVQDNMLYINTADGSLEAISISNNTPRWHYTSSSFIFWPPQIVAGIVYVTTPAGPDLQNKAILAIQASTGSRLWQHQAQSLAYLFLSQASTGGMAYIGLGNAAMDVLNVSDGSLLWHYESPSPFLLTTVGPIVYANLENGTVDVLQANDGSLIWDFPSNIRASVGSTGVKEL